MVMMCSIGGMGDKLYKSSEFFAIVLMFFQELRRSCKAHFQRKIEDVGQLTFLAH